MKLLPIWNESAKKLFRLDCRFKFYQIHQNLTSIRINFRICCVNMIRIYLKILSDSVMNPNKFTLVWTLYYSITPLFSKITYHLSRFILAFVEKYVKSEEFSLLNMSEYAWMCLNKQDSEYASDPKYANIQHFEYDRVLNIVGFSV